MTATSITKKPAAKTVNLKALIQQRMLDLDTLLTDVWDREDGTDPAASAILDVLIGGELADAGATQAEKPEESLSHMYNSRSLLMGAHAICIDPTMKAALRSAIGDANIILDLMNHGKADGYHEAEMHAEEAKADQPPAQEDADELSDASEAKTIPAQSVHSIAVRLGTAGIRASQLSEMAMEIAVEQGYFRIEALLFGIQSALNEADSLAADLMEMSK